MNRIFLSFVLLIILFIFLGCGPASPEQAARMAYEHGQRYDTEMQRIEREGLEPKEKESNIPGGILSIIIFIIGLIIGALAREIYAGSQNQNQ